MKKISRGLLAAAVRSFCASASITAVLFVSTPVLAQDASTHAMQFDIEDQPLAKALNVWSKQTGFQVVWPADDAAARRISTSVQGRLDPIEALDALLQNTGLTYSLINGGRTVAIHGRKQGPGMQTTAYPLDTVRTLESGIQMAAIEQPVRANASDNPQAPHRTEKVDSLVSDDSQEEVVVTGSHIRGSQPIGSTLITIDRQDLDRSGYGRIQDVVEALPQNFAGVGEDYNRSFVSNTTYGSEVQLRGLGSGTTLTLINGRRAPGGGSLGAFTDIANIPISAIERVEILPDGASAIYGSDAIGGVVNISLRRDFEGAETRARFATSSGDANEQEISQLFGSNWSSGNVLLGYQYTQRDPLYNGDRRYTQDLDLREFGGSDHRRDIPLNRGAAPGNILDAAGQVAFAIPAGQDGTQLTAAQFLPGVTNYPDLSNNYSLPSHKMHSVFASLSQSFGDRLDVVFDAQYSSREARALSDFGTITVSVPSTNPFYVNPFGGAAPVRVEYDLTSELGPLTSAGKTETYSFSIAPTVMLGRDWRLAFSGSYGRGKTHWRGTNRIDNAAVAAAINDTNRATALNVFGDGTANNPATIASLRAPVQFDDAESAAWSTDVIAEGPLFALPGGVARLAVGIAYHSDSLDVVSNSSAQGHIDDTRDNLAEFVEVTFPIIGQAQGIAAARRLDLSIAARRDDYSDFGATTNPKLGLSWSLNPSLRLRGTWGTSFRAPPFYLSDPAVRPTSARVASVADPKSPTGRTSIFRITGILPNLKEETADVWTAGFDLTPLDGLQISGTYFDIAYRDKIQSPGSVTTMLSMEEQYVGTNLITRDPTPAQIAAVCALPGFVGTCPTSIGAIVDGRTTNVAVVDVRGVDLDLKYSFSASLGEFSTFLGGTYMFGYEQATTKTAPITDVVDTFENPLRLRLRGGASWAINGWSTSMTVNYAGSYKNPSVIPAARISSWTTFDAGVGYIFDRQSSPPLNGTEIRLSAINLFDKNPPFVDVFTGFGGGYDAANATLLGRTVALQAVKRW